MSTSAAAWSLRSPGRFFGGCCVLLFFPILTGCQLLTPLDGYEGPEEPPAADGSSGDGASNADVWSADASDAGGGPATDAAAEGSLDGATTADAGAEPEGESKEASPADGDAIAIDGRTDASPPDASAADTGAPVSSIAFRGYSLADSMSDSITVPVPASQPRDFIWLTLYTDLASTKVTAPFGWTLAGDRANTAGNFHSWWYYRFATTGEPAQYVFSLNQMAASAAIEVVYSGVAPALTSPIFTSDNQGSPFTAPSIDAPQAGAWVVTSLINDQGSGGSWSDPADPYVVRARSPFVFVADFVAQAAGPTDPLMVAHTNDGRGSVAVVVLTPATGP